MEVGKSEWAKKEEEILKFWQENKIFEQTLAKPAPRGKFVFYEGPPYANGLPGIHHLEARAFKDVILRYRTMRGFHVARRAGWDTHGLPIEMAVEKKLGLTSKKEIEEKVGIAQFVAAAKENVFFYKAEWEKFTRRIGYWLDFEHAYLTMSADYMESVWWIIKQANERGLLYQDYKVLPWCPRCGTALSSHELAQGYEEVENPAATVKFKVKNPEQHNLPANTFLLAWTTTPWTLPGNVALAVGEKIDYFLQQVGDEYLISAEPSAQQVPASQLVGLEYEPLFNFPELQSEQSHRVYAADFVTTAEGTGIVHTAVMYGQDDFELGAKHNLPKHHLVGEDGCFAAATPWGGKFVKEADPLIIEDLRRRGLLFKQETVVHTYPFCWRCQTPLIYYARDSWYLQMSALREELLAANEKINWLPAHIKDGRFGEWLREAKDWAISRERYWGTPLPVWQSADGQEQVVIGSLEELKRYTKKSGNRYFVMRHGEAENNKLNILSSRAENPHHLTARGVTAVHQTAENLRVEKIDLIVSSDFVRARESAEIIVQTLGLPASALIYDSRLREVDHGELNGQTIDVYQNYFKTEEEYFTKNLPGGESFIEVKRRMGEAIYNFESKYQGKNVLIVTHESPSWLLFAAARGADLPTTIAIRGSEPDFLKNAEVRPLNFTPLPHNADYELDLHRPFIDEVELIGESGAILKRAPEVLDVWFDSGAMPLAQNHYPFATEDILYPADFIAEAIDQTRGWFYTLLAVAVLLKRGAPYKNVICLGHILDREGKKMSKSVGNVVDPWLMVAKYGVDALRFWMYVVNAPGEPKNFDESGVTEVIRKVINPLMNVLAFYELYRGEAPASVSPVSHSPPHILDEWLVVYRDDLVWRTTNHLDAYQITEAARLIREFVADLSQWYLRRSRDRIKSGDVAALATLHDTLFILVCLLAPFMPFLAEQIYQKLRRVDDPISVHLSDWLGEATNAKLKTTSEKLLKDMLITRELSSLGLEARAESGIKVRQPLSRLTFRGEGKFNQDLIDLIKAEVNVREVVWQMDLSAVAVLDTAVTPELKLAGDLRELVRQIQDLRKRAGLRPGEPAVLRVSAKHAARSLIAEQAAALQRVASLKEIKFDDFLDAELSLSH